MSVEWTFSVILCQLSISIGIYYYMKNLTTSPVVLMVYVVKGRQYTHRCRRLNHKDDQRSTLIGTNFDASITGHEFDSTVQLPNFRLVVAQYMLYTIAQG